MFDRDAEISAPILNIALTYRNKKAGLKTKMCGVPHHSISGPISKLLAEGLHVAICDQMEPASAGKGLVKRAVTRVLSPGMVYNLEELDQLSANYMGAFDSRYLSFLDLSTGSAFYYEMDGLSVLLKLLEQFQPRELVLTSAQKDKCSPSLPSSITFSVFEKNLFAGPTVPSSLKKYESHPESVQRLISYIYCMQGEESLKILKPFEQQGLDREMYYSRQLYSHLEIFKSYEGSSKDTLFSAIRRTKTPCGARLLKRRMKSPLIDQNEIEKCYDQIDLWISNPRLLESARQTLGQMGDGERKLGQLTQLNCNARDLWAVACWLDRVLETKSPAQDKAFLEELKKAKILRDKIKHVLSPSSPASLKEGGMINQGVSPRLDEWIRLSKSSQTYLLEMERKEQKKLNIPSLKIRYNNIFGYYIEIRKTHDAKVPSYYIRKQTLTQAERYTTEELGLLEDKILSARAKQVEMEQKIFQDLRLEILEELPLLTRLCDCLSEMDLYSSLAFLAIENKYVRPRFSNRFKIRAGRHPVLEQKTSHEFVPNTVDFSLPQTVILTGPNMAGKSTLMRQMALTSLLAQSGCFVPADQAELPLFHKMFTRMGAGDLLSQGLSTFMLEMTETAEILEKADDKSLIILDEIGRGTATFDGMSLAQAILEFLTEKKKPLLFSATHYQELTQLASNHPAVCNASMAIREEGGHIHFLYLLKQGPANKSYGVHVARLAGLADSVLQRAIELLDRHESHSHQNTTFSAKAPSFQLPAYPSNSPSETIGLQKKQKQQLIKSLMKEILDYPLMTQTPIDALNQIQKWQKKLKLITEQKSEKTLKTKTPEHLDQDFLPDILN